MITLDQTRRAMKKVLIPKKVPMMAYAAGCIVSTAISKRSLYLNVVKTKISLKVA